MDHSNQNLPYGATPIDADEMSQLIPKHIRFLSELNELEQRNILNAVLWLQSAKKKEFNSISFILKLHKKMFEDVWKWAGQFRRSNKNIGCEWQNVQTELKKLLQNIQYWVENETYSIDEICARLHHKLVFIYPFPNGNGRHARLYCDTFMILNKQKPLSWGQNLSGDVRKQYINCLRMADEKNFESLIQFVRS